MALTVWDLLKTIENLKKQKLITDKTKIVYSTDDEWNDYKEVIFTPSLWKFNKNGSFFPKADYDSFKKGDYSNDEKGFAESYMKSYEHPNAEDALCIN